MPESWQAMLKKMPATFIIIAVNIAVFLLSCVLVGNAARIYNLQALSLYSLANGRWWTLLTSMFMHGGAMHLLCNMVSLYYLGSLLERMFGTPRFCILYFASGLAGGAATIIWHLITGTDAWSVGASGAIFGLFGAYGAMLLIEYKHPLILPREAAKRSLSSFGGLLAVNIVISFMPGIAGEAHLGGLLMGVIIGTIYCLWFRKKARERFNQGMRG